MLAKTVLFIYMKNRARCVSNKHKPLSGVDGDCVVLSLSPSGVSHSGDCRKDFSRCVPLICFSSGNNAALP